MTDKSQKSLAVNTAGEGVLHPSTGTIDPEFSKRITALRFVLACFVVFIHAHVTDINFADGTMELQEPLWSKAIRETIAQIWSSIAVPLFFVISGYLFFAKPKTAVQTVKSKFKGIFLPYVLWTVLTILLYFTAQSFEFSKPYFANPDKIIRNWGIGDYLSSFWGIEPDKKNDTIYPLVFPLWYVRDLMVMFIVSPVIKFAAKKQPLAFFVFVTTLLVMRMLGFFRDPYSLTTALFYFTLGYYAVNHIDGVIKFIDSFKWRDTWIAYIISFALTLFLKLHPINGCGFIIWFNLMFTMALALKIAGVAVNNEKIFDKLSYLSGFSFWIFAAHAPFLIAVVTKLGAKILPMTGGWILVHFFGVFVICVGLLLMLGIALKKWLPKVYTLFNGGR